MQEFGPVAQRLEQGTDNRKWPFSVHYRENAGNAVKSRLKPPVTAFQCSVHFGPFLVVSGVNDTCLDTY